MKSPIKILTTTAVAGALVAGGIAGAAPAFADSTVTATPTLSVSTNAVVVPAFTASAPISFNSNAGRYGDVTATVVVNGATYSGGNVYQDDSGNATVDLLSLVSKGAYNYGDVPAGSYTITFNSAADSSFTCNADYSDCTTTNFNPATSAPVTLTVTKLATSISGWKTKSKSARHGKDIKISSPTVHNPGASAKWVFQYKKRGGKTWKTSESGTLTFSAVPSVKFKTHAFNTIKHKIAKRGTYYFRFTVKSSAFITGASTKQIKITWK